MKSKNVEFYYFSGSGNTFLAVKALAGALREKGLAVKLLRIEKSDPAAIGRDAAIGLAFPVAAFSTYPFVWRFIEALPPGGGREAFMLDTMGGGSGAIVGRLKKILSAKGYEPIGACEIIMPPNIFTLLDENAAARRISLGTARAKEYAEALVSGAAQWPRVPVISDISYFLYKLLVGSWKWKWGQKKFLHRFDRQACTKCGLCAELCPVANIAMREGYPVFGLNCEYCMRCASFCPAKAIISKFHFRNKVYRAADLPFDR